MGNLLLNPLNWTDSSGNNPPACWNGTSYVVVNDSADLMLRVVPKTSDTLGGTMVSAGGLTISGINFFNANGDVIASFATAATPVTFSTPAFISGQGIYETVIFGGNGCTSDTVTVTPTSNPSPPAPCDELGRVTRSFVSGYTASRTESRRVRRFSQRCVTANFNGALAPGRTIVHVRWDTTSPWSILMENPRIIAGQRQVAIDVSFNFAGWGGLLATVTLDNGEVYNQEFFYTVLDRPIYPGAVYPSSTGPYVLEADA